MNIIRSGFRSTGCCALAGAILLTVAAHAQSAELFVEAESFASPGGWMLDTQFIDLMGSPYLLAHGLGVPVKDAETRVGFPAPGEYHVWARTKDWVATWKAPGTPGKFQLVVDGRPLAMTFGTEGADWHWQEGGGVHIAAADEHALALHDLTGFDGRCDALFFSTDAKASPPQTREDRRRLLNLPRETPETEVFDLVVCGGGYSGIGAAISAARQGLTVALLQNRGVLGGNGSSEVQVWAQGGTKRGLFPHLGEIVEEFADHAKNSPGEYEEFGDAKKEAIVRAEKKISLFLHNHVIGVELAAGASPGIRSVTALDTRTGAERRFRGKFFADCTGHGTIGALAGASFTMQEKGHMGMSNMWKWQEADHAPAWPETPWALPLEANDFPATKLSKDAEKPFYKGEWFWETGFDKHPIKDLEYMRDWNLRAVYGAFSALKHGKDAAKHANAQLVWVAAIGGPRESRLLTGDIVLTDEDIVSRREFPDGTVPTTWDLDLHYPKEQYMKKFPDDPFISRTVRQGGRSEGRLSGAVSLLLFEKRRQPVHGRALHQREPRRARHHPRHAHVRHDGGSGRQGSLFVRGQAGRAAECLRELSGRPERSAAAARRGPA